MLRHSQTILWYGLNQSKAGRNLRNGHLFIRHRIEPAQKAGRLFVAIFRLADLSGSFDPTYIL